jgi:mRNA-degrading endonuclease RelE of RelBE toxin-antitoxin system
VKEDSVVMFYAVELTNIAEGAYDRFYEKAHTWQAIGVMNHSDVRRFKLIQDTLDNVLPDDPCRPDRALAGVLCYIYVLKVGQITFTYTVNEAKPAVIVQTIGRTTNDDTMRDWITTRIESGELVPVLESLGIQPYLARIEVGGLH